MPSQRVAITGMGMISALGANLAENWPSLIQGKSGIAPMQSVDVSKLRFQNGAEVRGFDPEQHFESGQLGLLDRFSQFALIAAQISQIDPANQAGRTRSAAQDQIHAPPPRSEEHPPQLHPPHPTLF